MSTTRRAALIARIALIAASLAPSRSRADPPLVSALRALPSTFSDAVLGPHGSTDVLWVRPGGAVTFGSVPRSALGSLTGGAGEVSVGAVRFPLLDVSGPFVHADVVRSMRGLTGRGVAVGVVDTGCDVRHEDLRTADGHTRIAWLLDLSRPARGTHPDLEQRFGIERDGVSYGAVFAAADLDALLGRESATGTTVTEIPTDDVGHGTYVASIAAGNGRATGHGQPAGRFVGMAPEATLLVVRANEATTDRISDAAIVAGTAFVLDRAAALGMPVAVNLSIGSHYGTHDGGSALEQALASLLGTDVPGRGLAVAAGNEGLGDVHARVDLASNLPGEMDLALAEADTEDLTVVQIAYEGAASIGVRFPSGASTSLVDAGGSRGFADGNDEASIANATDETPHDSPSLMAGAPVHGATVVFSGDPLRMSRRDAGRYAIVVRGNGAVHAWIADTGRASPRAHFVGGVIAAQTIAVPATSPALVSVGAVATRYAWSSVTGQVTHAAIDVPVGAVSRFSSLGPNRVNEALPDLVAPGEWIVAALSAQATPDRPLSIFEPMGSQAVESDGVHAAARGSSAAAPHVAGAMALLLQAHPSATQTDLRAAFTSATGDRPAAWDPGAGWGTLQIDAALARLDAVMNAASLDPLASRLATTEPAVASNEPLSVLVRLVDTTGAPFASDATVTLNASAGEPLQTSAASRGGGLFESSWRARGVAAGSTVTFRARVNSVDLPNAVSVAVVRDVANGNAGYTSAGGCSMRGARSARASLLVMLAALIACRRRQGRVRVSCPAVMGDPSR